MNPIARAWYAVRGLTTSGSADENSAKTWDEDKYYANEVEHASDGEYMVWTIRALVGYSAVATAAMVYLAVQPLHNLQRLEHQVISVPVLPDNTRLPAQIVTGRMVDPGAAAQGEAEEFARRLVHVTGNMVTFMENRAWVDAHLYSDMDALAVRKFLASMPHEQLLANGRERTAANVSAYHGLGGQQGWTVTFDIVTWQGTQEVERRPWVMTAEMVFAPPPRDLDKKLANPLGIYLRNPSFTEQKAKN